MRQGLEKLLKVAALLLFTLILWWFCRTVDWPVVQNAISRADLRLITVALALVCATYLLRAYRWKILLAPTTPASIKNLFASTVIGFGAVFLFGRAGEIARPTVLPLYDKRVSHGASLVTILVERIFDLAAVTLFFSINLLWFKPPTASAAEFSHMRWGGFLLLSAFVLGITALVLMKWQSKRVALWLEQKSAPSGFFINRLCHFLKLALAQLDRALNVLTNVRQLVAMICWTAVIWLTIISTTWIIMLSFGLKFGLAETLFVMCWSIMGSLLPTPGGAAGAFHAAMATGLIFLGSTLELAAAISIVTHFVTFSPALVLGLYYFARSGISFKYLRREAVRHRETETRSSAGLRLAKEFSGD